MATMHSVAHDALSETRSWILAKYTKLCGMRYEVSGTSGDLRVTVNGHLLIVSIGTSSLEEFSLSITPSPTIKSKENDVFFQVVSQVPSLGVENDRKRANSEQRPCNQPSKVFCENSTEMKSSSQESVTNSSQHSLLHPAIRRCIIYDRTFNKSSAPKDKPRTIPARVFSTTAAEDDQVVPTAQENDSLKQANAEKASPPDNAFDMSQHRKAVTSFRDIATQTEKGISTGDLTNDAVLLLKEVSTRQSDPDFFALERKCRLIVQRMLLEEGWILFLF
ncbi:unnamed protein product [Toxocara canis]|uniref:Lipin_N domain-containing protein n=1 Tax=Toxocara canis TaxID=6265 RepID=A0A183VBR3_TOXCA|nr:unnamed protein product [Toxocara canis]